jgi:hypothetical protein
MGKLVEMLHALERPFRRYTQTEYSYTLLPVYFIDMKTPAVDFECIR